MAPCDLNSVFFLNTVPVDPAASECDTCTLVGSACTSLEKIKKKVLFEPCDLRPLHVTGTSPNDDRQWFFVVGVKNV